MKVFKKTPDAETFTADAMKKAWRFWQSFLIAALLLALCRHAAQAQGASGLGKGSPAANQADKSQKAPAPDAFRDVPTQSLQTEADRLDQKLESLQDQLASFTDYAAKVSDAEKNLPDNIGVTPLIAKVKDAYAKLKAENPDANVSSGKMGTLGSNFGQAVNQLQFALRNQFVDVTAKVVPSFRYGPLGSSNQTSPPEQTANDAASRVNTFRNSDPFFTALPNINALLGALMVFNGEVKRSAVDQEINAAQQEIASLPDVTRQVFTQYKTDYTEVLDAVSAAMKQQIDKLQATLDSDKQQWTEMNKVLLNRSQAVGTRQATLTDYSIYTEMLMMGVIVFAMIFLRFYPEKLALTVVQERMFGDMLGMGLLLVTVVFLATGAFVDQSAVVTLLGTIAGYIFGRRSPSSVVGAMQPAVNRIAAVPAAPGNVREALPRVSREASVSCDPVPNAVAYRWYAKSQNEPGDPVFRQQTSAPHVVLSGFHTGDQVVITVSATNGQESGQSPPLIVPIT